MRGRDKRKKEQKALKNGNKKLIVDAHLPAVQNKPMPTPTVPSAPTPLTRAGKAQQPTLPPTEKVAFDNRIKRKNVLALNEKVAALREYERQPIYKHVGRMFNCSPDQIKRIVQQKDEILRAWEQRTRHSQDGKTQELKVVRVSMLGKAVYEWLRRMMYYNDFTISDGLIQKMALQFKNSMGLNHFFPHQEWCDKFRNTYSIHHNDTRQLAFGYTQSSSVQINDIVKDVMSECTPAADLVDSSDDEGGNASLATGSGHSHAEEDDDDVDIDGSGNKSDSEDNQQRDVKPTLAELNQGRMLPQIMRLPQVAPGTSQKVLLATPILPPGAAVDGAQTMTIIPLTTLAQSIIQRPALQPKAGMPPPMTEIKQEIKQEPPDIQDLDEEQPQTKEVETQAENVQESVCIKPELDSDDELFDDDDEHNGGRSSVTSLAEILAANVDDEKQYIEQTRALRQRKRCQSITPMSILPPMPPLTKAPTRNRPEKRPRQPDDNNNPEGASGQMVISCAEARKYLKLLEEFALSKENLRLIGLITRADEVMRELEDT